MPPAVRTLHRPHASCRTDDDIDARLRVRFPAFDCDDMGLQPDIGLHDAP